MIKKKDLKAKDEELAKAISNLRTDLHLAVATLINTKDIDRLSNKELLEELFNQLVRVR